MGILGIFLNREKVSTWRERLTFNKVNSNRIVRGRRVIKEVDRKVFRQIGSQHKFLKGPLIRLKGRE